MTLSTLRFGGTASTITNEVAANILSDKNAEMLAAYQRDIDEMKLELEQQRLARKAKTQSALAAQRELEERIAKLSKAVFKKNTAAKAEKPEEEEKENMDSQLWSKTSGHVTIDSRLTQSNYVSQTPVSFDIEACKTLADLRKTGKTLRARENQLKKLNSNFEHISNTNSTLQTDMKAHIDHCKELHNDKEVLKKKLNGAQERYDALWKCVSGFADGTSLESMPSGDLIDLEDLLSHTIDAVKTAKIKRDITGPFSELGNRRKLSDILGLNQQMDEKENSPSKFYSPSKVVGDFSDNLLKFTR